VIQFEKAVNEAWIEMGGKTLNRASIRGWLKRNCNSALILSLAVEHFIGELRAKERIRALDAEREAMSTPEGRARLEQEAEDYRANQERIQDENNREDRELRRAWRESELRAMNQFIDLLNQDLHMAWTRGLLGQPLHMPDGTETTWGEATVDQHQTRVKMFEANVLANGEGAARHMQAIEAIESAGVACLNELPVAVSA
jgi:hypothetical protein